ncbi:UNVERIFIED_CONTAM: hypothetical protein K0B97_09060, partial [Spiribacter pallidus]
GGSEAIDSLTVNGAAMVAADITTVGDQHYGVSNAGAVNVRGADVTFKATASDADVVFEGDLLAGATAYDQATLLDYDDKSAGSWTLPLGTTELKVWAIGAGGGGAGARRHYTGGQWRNMYSGGGGGAGGVAYYTLSEASGLNAISYVIGKGGIGPNGGADGADGGDTTVTVSAVEFTAEGGEGGRWTGNIEAYNAVGGFYSGNADGGSRGGYGGDTWDEYGGSGGGAIGGGSGYNGTWYSGGYGGRSADVDGLQAALELADSDFADNSSKPKGIGAERADDGNGSGTAGNGGDAKSFGGGGGGGDSDANYNDGGDGFYGGGGGGAGTVEWAAEGGTGGDGAVVIRYSLAPQSVTIDAGDDVRVGGDLTGETVTIKTGDGATGVSDTSDGSNVAGKVDVADSGAGLTKQGGGTLKLTANNTFTGD